MRYRVFPSGPLLVNTLLIWDETSRKAILVDPAGELYEVEDTCNRNELEVVYIVNTHEHPDHTAKNALAKLTFRSAKLIMHPLAAENLNFWTESEVGILSDAEFSPPPDMTVDEGDVIEAEGVRFEVLHTPGHSPGSIVLKSDELAVVGDLIFRGGIGRYDLPMSSYDELKSSIIKLFEAVGRNVKIIPGHGPATTVEHELEDNPFIRGMFR